jgi:hypothetical protein
MRLVGIFALACVTSVGCAMEPADTADEMGLQAPAGGSETTASSTPAGGTPSATGGMDHIRTAIVTSGGDDSLSGTAIPPASPPAGPASRRDPPHCEGIQCEPDPQPWGPPNWSSAKK